MGVLTPIYAATTDILSVGHGLIGIPWVLAIPLTALTIKTITTALLKNKNEGLNARNYMTRVFSTAAKRLEDDTYHNTLRYQEQSVRDDLKATGYHYYKPYIHTWMKFNSTLASYRYQVNVFSPIWWYGINFSVWLLISDTLRLMLGTSGGLLSGWILPKHLIGNAQALIEPSLASANQGLPWCTLTSIDPYFILPAALVGLTFHLLRKSGAQQTITKFYKANYPRLSQRMPMDKYLIPLLVPIGGLYFSFVSGFPSGMLLYWISSAAFSPLYQAYHANTKQKRASIELPPPCREGFDAFQPTPLWLSQRPVVIKTTKRSS